MLVRALMRIHLLCALLILVPSGPANATRITLSTGSLVLRVCGDRDHFAVMNDMFSQIGFPPFSWQISKVSSSIYHIQLPKITDRFLKIDLQAGKVLDVSNGTFGRAGGIEKEIPGAHLVSPYRDMMGNSCRFHCELPPGIFVYDTESHETAVQFAGYRILDAEEVEVIEPEEGIVHFRVRDFQRSKRKTESFWKVDIARKMLKLVTGTYGKEGGEEITFTVPMSIEDRRAALMPEPTVHKDLGLLGVKKGASESPWFGAEKDLTREVLRDRSYDMLIVPVQVQDNAFDPIERRLMTQALAHAVSSATGVSVVDPKLAERALGWNLRTYSDQEVYSLANMLNVRTLVRTYAGHSRDMKMRLTVVRQTRPEPDGSFDTAVKAKETVLTDIPFSDERLPSDALFDMIPGILSALGIENAKKPPHNESIDLAKIPFPPSPIDLIQAADRSSFLKASNLIMLGAFSPSGTWTSEDFFERSLTLLRTAPQRSATVRFLRAYALANLYRRPAAIGALGKESTPELVALRFYLDGNLTSLSSEARKIKSPVPKILMLIALNDLVRKYDPQTARVQLKSRLQELPAGWRMFGERRLTQTDPWKVPSNSDLKAFLDEHIPVKDYTLQDVARSMAVRGDLGFADSITIDTSVHIHCRKVLGNEPDKLLADAVSGPNRMDILDLATSWAEYGVSKNVSLRARTQGMYEDAIALADKYEVFFRGHIDLLSHKIYAMQNLAKQKDNNERRNLERMADAISRDICLWSGGQTPISAQACTDNMAFFENDFPRRPFWRVGRDSSLRGDRTEYQLREVIVTTPAPTTSSHAAFAEEIRSELTFLELAFRYTITDEWTMNSYHSALVKYRMEPEAAMLIERNKHRFTGNPRIAEFLAKILLQKGDEKALNELYEETMRSAPGAWGPRYSLGMQQLRQGDVKNAANTFDQYPFFRNEATGSGEESVDTVGLSNIAYAAGVALHWTGAVDEARRFYTLSAGYQTGSGRGMRSEYLLALDDKNYELAAAIALQIGKRYQSTTSYSDYLHLLNIVRNAPEVESLYFSLNLMGHWTPILSKLRMEGKSDDEIREWLSKNGKGRVTNAQASQFYLRAFLVDRRSDPALADRIENIGTAVQVTDPDRTPMKTVDGQGRFIPPLSALFVSSRHALMQGQFKTAFELLLPWSTTRLVWSDEGKPLLPYFAWSAIRSGLTSTADPVIDTYRKKYGRDFEYWLATAMMQSARGQHKDANRSLGLARANVNSSLAESRPVQAWYQLIESCELLYADTKVESYRDLARDLAKLYQRIQPLDSWAYAVEVTYAKTAEERMRPLAITLYLDPRSSHIIDISEQEKTAALKWLETNNPFLRKTASPRKEVAVPADVLIAHMQ